VAYVNAGLLSALACSVAIALGAASAVAARPATRSELGLLKQAAAARGFGAPSYALTHLKVSTAVHGWAVGRLSATAHGSVKLDQATIVFRFRSRRWQALPPDGGGFEAGCGLPRRAAHDLALELCSLGDEENFQHACEEIGGTVEEPDEVQTCIGFSGETRTPAGYTTPRI
jgi:hypothetical protein